MKPHLLQPPLHYKYSWEESHRGRENLYNQNTQYRQRINLIGDISQKRQQRQSNYDNESADVWLFQIAKVIPWSYDYQEVNYTSLNFQQRNWYSLSGKSDCSSTPNPTVTYFLNRSRW